MPAPRSPSSPVPAPAEPTELAALRARVDHELRRFTDAETEALLAVDEDLAPLAAVLADATAHGKRLRSAFCYWGWRSARQPDSEAMVRAAASMELVHAAAVVHDDIIDDSHLRHGLPTAHVALRSALTRGTRGTRVNPRAASLAMLAGDLLMSWAGQLFTGCGLPGAYLARGRPLWGVLARELVAGEALEILRTAGPPDVARSLKVIRYKTAKYTVEHPLHIGAALAGGDADLREAFTAYGLPLGEAFQLRDDLLGLFGEPEHTGKANTDDITGARPTALIAHALAEAAPAERRELTRLLGRSALTDAQLDLVRGVVESTGARARVERMIGDRVSLATRAIDGAGLPAPAHTALTHLATAVTTRPA
ncbi:polyprenyl synthetase family protein [Streptomyces sp. NBC_00102]|uniref:polyprenyl synthetase family protein n=1 Tax=Streptomyces sp. NBC_00102 TaxID=2975652 RepID=UPI002259B7F4|nr:polyprenyl synthetase family protein [Streptomyces sp. NBC_00102]MCX5396411.1 polyprenyl synthetase family protein [Streptomyces sp. NBC_00102]